MKLKFFSTAVTMHSWQKTITLRQFLVGCVFLFSFLLASCASTRVPVVNRSLTNENWMPYVETNAAKWAQGADKWFLTGDPSNTEIDNRQAPYSAAISTMMVNVPNFTSIQSNGDFQVQIFGTTGNNSVFIYGPNNEVRQTTITVQGNMLCIGQKKHASADMHKVIIRIGVNRLNGLIQQGRGCIEGIHLLSDGLSVVSTGSGNIYLAGNINLQRVINAGRGSITIFGANTSLLDIKTTGTGSVNVSGSVGVRRIAHYGNNNINIIGANSSRLKIYAQGAGKIGIKGQVNLCSVVTRQNTCVYIVSVSSGTLSAVAFDHSSIGLTGFTENLYVDTYQSAKFAGRYLCAHSAYVRAYNSSHINVTATNKIFAAASQNASVYFFGAPTVMSRFVSGNGIVIPILYANIRICPVVTIYPYPYIVKMPETRAYKAKKISPLFAGEG